MAAILAQWAVCLNTCGHNPALGVPGADLSPNLFTNILFYILPCGGTQLAFYILRRFYQFGYWHVFWITGLLGSLEEGSGYVLQPLLAGDIFSAVITYLVLIPAYAVPLASIFLIFPDNELPHGKRLPKLLGYLLLVALPWILSRVASFIIGMLFSH